MFTAQLVSAVNILELNLCFDKKTKCQQVTFRQYFIAFKKYSYKLRL